MGLGYITLTRKAGECSIGIKNGTNPIENPEELLVVRYSEIDRRNRLKVCHSGRSYYFTRYGGNNDEKRAEDFPSMIEIFAKIKDLLRAPANFNFELFNGQCFAAYPEKHGFSDPNSVAVIGILPIRAHQGVRIDVWGEAYRIALPHKLDISNEDNAQLRALVQERIKSAGLEKAIRV